MLGSQITDNSKKGLGYHAVPPPHPLIYNAPTKLDLSYSRLEEFKQPEFEGYGVKVDKSVCEKSSKEIKKTPDAPIIEDLESDSDDEKKPKSKVEKKIGVSKTVSPTVSKIEFVRPKQQEKPVRKPVKYAEMYSFDHLHIHVLAKVGTVSYRLELSEKLSRVHSTFHVSNMNKYLSDETIVIPLDEIQIDDKLKFLKETVKIMDREVKLLGTKLSALSTAKPKTVEGLKTAGYRVITAGSRLLLLVRKSILLKEVTTAS
ncbi:hypothetical protein Tco_1112442 [Tanacetum coccineum]|uniref:Tf2-1-like SH3-like domain-containing protein n=1 Tax=Tanacetum coccineum TaxID=301880 RepID=A0ABQ5IPN6_9ASTR